VNKRPDFEATRWSIVLAAAREDSTSAQIALERLCEQYWSPLVAFLLRQGFSQSDAEDLTQSFFASRVVTRLVFRGASPEGGKFRSWLLSSLKNFLRNEWDKSTAQKRGGMVVHLSIEQAQEPPETNGGRNPAEIAFDRAFSLALLERAIAELKVRYEVGGKGRLFDELRVFLPGATDGGSYTEVATRLGKSQDAVEVAVGRLRREFGTLVRAEISRTTSNAVEAEEELRYFLDLWREAGTPL
jgi:RNA polymerase sigma factor (sigma-70 family)